MNGQFYFSILHCMHFSQNSKIKQAILLRFIDCDHGCCGRNHIPCVDCMYMQLVHINTKVASLFPAHHEVYWLQHYVIRFIDGWQHIGGSLHLLGYSPPLNLTGMIEVGKLHGLRACLTCCRWLVQALVGSNKRL